MPSFSDSIFLFVLALLLFGPKKLPELARYLGKLMGEFRRASAEFRLQMDDEFRAIEQAEQQKKIAAIEAAAPVASLDLPEPEHPHMPPATQPDSVTQTQPSEAPILEPVPIASSGDLHMRVPATGLPVSRSGSAESLGAMLDAIPHTADPAAVTVPTEHEANTHG